MPPKKASKLAGKGTSTSRVLEDIGSILSETNNILKEDTSLLPFAQARVHSDKYVNQQSTDEVNFMRVIEEHNPQLYSKLFRIDERTGFPLFFKLTSENNDVLSTREQRVKLFNEIVKIYVINVRNKRDDEPLQASTTNAFLRRFLAHIKMKYNIVMSLKDDFNFSGGLVGKILIVIVYQFQYLYLILFIIFSGTLSQLYALRSQQDPKYGCGKSKQILNEAEYNIWDLAVETLNQNDARQMTMLVLILCGCFMALRGNEEHANLSISNVQCGEYLPTSEFHGWRYIEIVNLLDKSHKLRCVRS